MPYTNPFDSAATTGAMLQQNVNDTQKRIQDAYIQREANERASVKQQHDLAVSDLETRMKMQQMGAQQVDPSGNVPLSGQLAQGQTQAGNIQQPAAAATTPPGSLQDSMALAPPQLPPQNQPASLSPMTQSIIQGGTQYQGSTPADPNLTDKTPDGQSWQIPSMAQRAAMQRAADQREADAAGAKAGAEEGAKKQADADDLDKNGVTVPKALADYLGLPPGQKAMLKDLHGMIAEESTRRHNETIEAQNDAKQIDQENRERETERHNRATEGVMADRLSQSGGDGSGKPMTAGQKQVQLRADQKQLSDLQSEEYDLNDQRNKLAAGVKTGKVYFDDKGKATPMDDTDAPALVQEMSARHAAAGERLKQIAVEKNGLITRMGGTPRVSADQVSAAIDKGSLSGGGITPNPGTPTVGGTAPMNAQPRPQAQPKAPAPTTKIAMPADITRFAKANKISEAQARQAAIDKGWTIGRP